MTSEKAIELIGAMKGDLYDFYDDDDLTALEMAIESLKRENVKGEWTEWKGRDGRYQGIPICSNCNTAFPRIAKEYKFCPECGCQMMRGDT